MRNLLCAAVSLCLINTTYSQGATLTLDQIMMDPKWIGSSPSGTTWAYNCKIFIFGWNPKGKTADSSYKFVLYGKEPVKATYEETQLNYAIDNGEYTSTNTQITYDYRNDIYLLDLKTNKTTRITKTEEAESNPKFFMNNEWIVFSRNQNLYAWSIQGGITQQLTNIARGAETPANPAGGTGAGARGGGRGFSGRGGTPVVATAGASRTADANQQDKWLQEQQLKTSDILKERKQKNEERVAFLKSVRSTDTLKTINVGDRAVQSLQISPTGRFVTYRCIRTKKSFADLSWHDRYEREFPGCGKIEPAVD